MNTSLLGGLVFVLVFAGIILLHELGHFSVARLFKIDVEEFGIGLPPRLRRLWRGKGLIVVGKESLILPLNFDLPFDHKTSLHRPVDVVAVTVRGKLVAKSVILAATEDGQFRPDASTERKDLPNGEVHLTGILNEAHPGTEFTLNWIPLGGFNKFPGEDNPDQPGGLAAANPWKRILVLLSGAAMNLLTAIVVYTVIFSQMGIPDRRTVVIAAVNEGSPAQQVGIQPGDIVASAGGIEVTSSDQLIEITYANLGVPLELVLVREGEELEISVTPRATPPEGEGPIGIGLGNPIDPAKTWFHTLPISVTAVGQDINNLLSLPGRLIAGTLSPEEAQMGGPRTIWNLFQQSVSRDVESRQVEDTGGETTRPTNYTLLIIISLTTTVGIANLLPIPALDGGRIFMSLIEIVVRRKIPAKYQMAINGVSYIILLLLLGYFYIKDIISPVLITLP